MKAVPQESMRKNIMAKENGKKKKRMILATVLLLIFLLTGCSQEEELVEITFIHGFGTSENTHEAMRQIYQDFEKEHSSIKLNMISMPSSEDVEEKVGNMLMVGEVPDIVFMAGEGKDSIYEYMIAHDQLMDLMPYLKRDQEFYQNISPVMLEHWMTKEGNLYTVSDVIFMIGCWYNQDIFEEAGISEFPKTWEDFWEVCEQLKASKEQTEPLFLDMEHMVYLTNAILHESNEWEAEKLHEGVVDLNSPGFQKSIQYLKKIAQYTDATETYSFRDSLGAFNGKETAIYLNGVWGTYLIDQELNAVYAPFPSQDGNGTAMISSCVGYLLGNTGDQKKMEASLEFLKYMLSEPVAQRILKETGQMPSNPNITVDENIADGRLYRAVEHLKEAGHIIEVPANLWSRQLQSAFWENMILYVNNEITTEKMQKNIDEIFLNSR